MSKRKGRKQPLTSEIKSVLRAPEELESEPAPAPSEGDSEAPEADAALGAELGSEEASESEPVESAPDTDEPPARSKRGRRVSTQRSRPEAAFGLEEPEETEPGREREPERQQLDEEDEIEGSRPRDSG